MRKICEGYNTRMSRKKAGHTAGHIIKSGKVWSPVIQGIHHIRRT